MDAEGDMEVVTEVGVTEEVEEVSVTSSVDESLTLTKPAFFRFRFQQWNANERLP